MLEKPDLADERITACLQQAFGLKIADITFLPLGADLNTAVYRATTHDNTAYFVKLRGGHFDETAVTISQHLHHQGLEQIIPAIPTPKGQLWADLPPYKVILYPFVVGKDGYERPLTDLQWTEFGTALKQLHTIPLPTSLTQPLKREIFSPHWRETVRHFLQRMEQDTFAEPVAAAMAAFLQSKKEETLALVERTEQLAQLLLNEAAPFILCHADIHVWNLLISDEGRLYMVDWDTLILAPKERDLMFVGSGLGGNGRSPQEETNLFYQGYGQTSVNPIGLAYYRYERIIEDIGVSCEQIFLSDAGGEDRPQALKYLKSNFQPNGTIAMARQADPLWR